MLLGGALLAVSGWVRYAAALLPPPSHGPATCAAALLLVGQSLMAVGMPFVLAACPALSDAWFSADGRALLVHALDAPDPEAVRDEIKTRYERRLKEIFE